MTKMSKTKEEIKADEIAAEQVAEDAEEAITEEKPDEGDSEGEAQKSSSQIDYKAIAEQEREARAKAEKALAEKAFKFREEKRKVEEEEIDEDEDKPLTRKEFLRLQQEQRQQDQKIFLSSQARSIAASMADSEDEVEAIVEVFNNRTFPIHLSLEQQVREARAIVHLPKLEATNSELKRALKSKGTASKDGASAYRDPMPGSAPKISAQDAGSYKKAGFVFDTKDKLWKKKLPTGKYLIKDPRTKRTYIAQ